MVILAMASRKRSAMLRYGEFVTKLLTKFITSNLIILLLQLTINRNENADDARYMYITNRTYTHADKLVHFIVY